MVLSPKGYSVDLETLLVALGEGRCYLHERGQRCRKISCGAQSSPLSRGGYPVQNVSSVKVEDSCVGGYDFYKTMTTRENWNDGLSRKSEYFFRSSSLGWESLKACSLSTPLAKPMDGGSNSSLTCLKWKSLYFCSAGNSLLLLIHVVYTCTHPPFSPSSLYLLFFIVHILPFPSCISVLKCCFISPRTPTHKICNPRVCNLILDRWILL